LSKNNDKKSTSKRDKLDSEMSESQGINEELYPESSHLSNDLYALEIRQIM